MVDVLHHVYDQEKTARELWRVTMPEGKIIIEEPDISNWGVKLVALAEKIVLMRSHFLSPAKIKDLFEYYTDAIHLHKEGHNAWVVITKQ
jgi:2-polyprenyl-3-methyl-5-hydroxy-6-metoxy-1,4-benzoquinol methylase